MNLVLSYIQHVQWRHFIVVLSIAVLTSGDLAFSVGNIATRFQEEDEDDRHGFNIPYQDHIALLGSTNIEMLARGSRPSERRAAPSLLLISRVSLILLHQGPTIRTRLGFLSNVNYSSVIAQLDWLEAMGYVEYFVKDKEYAKLTLAGLNFAKRLEKLQMQLQG